MTTPTHDQPAAQPDRDEDSVYIDLTRSRLRPLTWYERWRAVRPVAIALLLAGVTAVIVWCMDSRPTP